VADQLARLRASARGYASARDRYTPTAACPLADKRQVSRDRDDVGVQHIAVGRLLRMVRIRHEWRQSDVASRAGISAPVVARHERGMINSLVMLDRHASALDLRLDLRLLGRSGHLVRMADEEHAAIVEAIAGWLRRSGFQVEVEASFSEWGGAGTDRPARVRPSHPDGGHRRGEDAVARPAGASRRPRRARAPRRRHRPPARVVGRTPGHHARGGRLCRESNGGALASGALPAVHRPPAWQARLRCRRSNSRLDHAGAGVQACLGGGEGASEAALSVISSDGRVSRSCLPCGTDLTHTCPVRTS